MTDQLSTPHSPPSPKHHISDEQAEPQDPSDERPRRPDQCSGNLAGSGQRLRQREPIGLSVL